MAVSGSGVATAQQRRPNTLALGLIGIGAVLGVLAYSVLDWFHGTFGPTVGRIHGSTSTAGDLGDLLDTLVTRRRELGNKNLYHLGLSDYYFSWLGWVLLVAAVVVAIVATLPTEEGGAVRALGVLLGVLGLAATMWAIDLYRPASHDPRVGRGPGFAAFWSHASLGAWAALAAFVLIGLGAVLGPRTAKQ